MSAGRQARGATRGVAGACGRRCASSATSGRGPTVTPASGGLPDADASESGSESGRGIPASHGFKSRWRAGYRRSQAGNPPPRGLGTAARAWENTRAREISVAGMCTSTEISPPASLPGPPPGIAARSGGTTRKHTRRSHTPPGGRRAVQDSPGMHADSEDGQDGRRGRRRGRAVATVTATVSAASES